MSANVDGRAFVIRVAVLAVAALAGGACESGRLGGGASMNGVDAGPIDARPITLVAVGGPAGSVMAEVFVDEPGVGPQTTCATPVNAGACQLTSCQLGPINDPAPGYGNFGPVYATVGMTTVTLAYGFTGYPTVGFPAAVALGTGGKMRFQGGDGVTLPVFDISTIIPGLPVLTSPATDSGTVIVDTSQDLSITWAPIAIGQIWFNVYGAVPSGGDLELTVICWYDGASGSGVVPQPILAALRTMAGTTQLNAALGSELDATTVVDGVTIVTTSHQGSPTTGHSFGVIFQ